MLRENGIKVKDISNKRKRQIWTSVFSSRRRQPKKQTQNPSLKSPFVNNFQHLLKKKATENNNSKNSSNIAIRKRLKLGTAVMTVMQIFYNFFQLFTPTIRKWARGLLRNNSNKKVALNNHYHQERITRRPQISKIIQVQRDLPSGRKIEGRPHIQKVISVQDLDNLNQLQRADQMISDDWEVDRQTPDSSIMKVENGMGKTY